MSGGLRKLISGAYLERVRAILPRWVVEVVVALCCVTLSAVFRVLLDQISPGALAFGLIYPIALLATLVAGWRSGVLTLVVAGAGAWYFVMPPKMSFAVKDFASGVNVVAFFISGGVVVLLTSIVMAELQARIDEHKVMRREADHRVKNNFQMVLSILELQAARSADPAFKAAMTDASSRVAGFARAHRRLYAAEDSFQSVNLAAYLSELCEDLSEVASFGRAVRFDTDLADYPLSHDRTVAVGAIVNELVTNALKHAFEPGDPGEVRVSLAATGDGGCSLTVADGGKGLPADFRGGQGLGHRILTALVSQAEGALTVNAGPGASFTLNL
jgi:two-component sensor histidine kinase